MAVGISVAAEHRPMSLDGATSTHVAMDYVTNVRTIELIFLHTHVWRGLFSQSPLPASVSVKVSFLRNFWLCDDVR